MCLFRYVPNDINMTAVKINDITDDQVMPLKIKNYPIIYEASFPISVHLRKFGSCSKRSNILRIILKWPWLVLEADGYEASVLRNQFLTNQISIY